MADYELRNSNTQSAKRAITFWGALQTAAIRVRRQAMIIPAVCRQVMMEFCDPPEFRVITAISEEQYVERTLAELLPEGFGPENL